MKSRMKLLSLALLGAFVTPAFAATDAEIEEMQAQLRRMQVKLEALEDAREDYGFKGLKISGMMDPTYIANKRRDNAGFNFLSNFTDTDGDGNQTYAYDNSYFGQLLLNIEKETDSGTKWKLALVPHKSTSSGYNLGSIVHEASVSIPLSDLQTRLIAGQFPDWSGYEYYFGHQNKLISHNLLFDFTLPSFYQGAGLEIVRGKWIIKSALANFNKVSHPDGETNQVITYRVDYAKGEFQGFGFAGQHGKVLDKKADMFEVDAYFIRGDWTVFGQASYGKWKQMAFNGKDAEWSGASVYAGYKLTPRFELIARADYIKNDKNGGGTIGTAFGCVDTAAADPLAAVDCDSTVATQRTRGDYRNGFGPSEEESFDYFNSGATNSIKGANRSALSLGAHFAVNANTALKFEYRMDRSSQPTFFDVKGGTYGRTNSLIGTSLVVTF